MPKCSIIAATVRRAAPARATAALRAAPLDVPSSRARSCRRARSTGERDSAMRHVHQGQHRSRPHASGSSELGGVFTRQPSRVAHENIYSQASTPVAFPSRE
eukprot:1858934-Prymnesium_polylepis.2